MRLSFGCWHSFARPAGVLLLIAAVLAGCASRPGPEALTVSLEEAKGTREVDILIATTRARSGKPHELFSSERSEILDFGEATISLPPTHEPGEIEWPSSSPGDPNKHFVVRKADYIDGEEAFSEELDQRLKQLPKANREALLFIHGYNTRFAEGVFRLAQIVGDARQPGVPMLFTWASRGYLTDYIYDNNSVALARDGLEETLHMLTRSKAKSVTVVAHSLGNLLLLETLRQMELKGTSVLRNKKVTVVMASPDIDIDVFKKNIVALGLRANPIYVIVSRDDRALQFSRHLAGGKERVGGAENDEALAALGVVVIDLTDVETKDATNHSKFAQLAQFGPEFQRALEEGQLQRSQTGIGGRISNAGRSFTSLLSNTAKIVITTPGTIAAQ